MRAFVPVVVVALASLAPSEAPAATEAFGGTVSRVPVEWFGAAPPLALAAPPMAAPPMAAPPMAVPPMAAPEGMSEFALLAPLVDEGLIAARGMTREKKKPREPKEAKAGADSVSSPAPKQEEEPARRTMKTARTRRMGGLPGALSGDRARLMLQSLTVPGWGQATLGQRRAALAFSLVELGTWGSFSAFRIQQHMRQQTYESTARLFGGIELDGRDEEYRRIVGLYASSEEYNRLVVRRDAANLYYGDPAAYDAYVAAHEIHGGDAWAWNTEDDFLRYRLERQAAQRASKHAQDALAVAVINRLLSVIHVSRSHPRTAPDQTSWRVEVAPTGGDPTAMRIALRADF
jgi:hypothetical protein